MKYLLSLLAAFTLTACQNVGTPEQQAAASKLRGKNVAKLEKRAWNVGGFLANLAGNILVNTATNFANEQMGNNREPSLRGFQK